MKPWRGGGTRLVNSALDSDTLLEGETEVEEAVVNTCMEADGVAKTELEDVEGLGQVGSVVSDCKLRDSSFFSLSSATSSRTPESLNWSCSVTSSLLFSRFLTESNGVSSPVSMAIGETHTQKREGFAWCGTVSLLIRARFNLKKEGGVYSKRRRGHLFEKKTRDSLLAASIPILRHRCQK